MLKILLLALAVVVALAQERGGKCSLRTSRSIRMSNRCFEPQMSLVQLDVPDGYDHVIPGVVKLPQCTGLQCSFFPEKCLPVPGRTKNHTYQVSALRRNDVRQNCMEVTVQEHLECDCGCEPRKCSSNRLFDHETCDCQKCNPILKLRCDDRRYIRGEKVMWSNALCSCECDNVLDCNSRQVWDPENCECAEL